MRQRIDGRKLRQVRRLRRAFQQQPDLCLDRLLPHQQITAVLRRHRVVFRDCLYTPLVTLWTFLYQVLCPDPSCRAAVAHLLAVLALRGDPSASPDTGPYCKARERLPEGLVADLARQSAAALQTRCPAGDLLHGRTLKIADGSTVSMPDTPANQQAYPQPPHQKPGLGFPILRLVVVISLSCGAVLDVAVSRYCGKKTGETALLRQLFHQFQKGDVALADALEILRCKTPAMVRKEIWMHLLAYNLIRTLLAEAAQTVGTAPRELSYKGALQTRNAFAPIGSSTDVDPAALYARLLQAIARHRVGDRPDRVEPRAVKRRPRPQTFLTQPRQIARTRLLTKD